MSQIQPETDSHLVTKWLNSNTIFPLTLYKLNLWLLVPNAPANMEPLA